MEKLLKEFDFDITVFGEDQTPYIYYEIAFLKKKFTKLFSEEKFQEVIDTLTGKDEYADFIETIKNFFLEMIRFQVIIKKDPKPEIFCDMIFSEYILSPKYIQLFNGLLFTNITKLFLIFATARPKTIHEIFYAFCSVFAGNPEFLRNPLVKSYLDIKRIFLETHYPEYKIAEMLKESLIK